MADQDTIFALATARGRSGVAIVRLSGGHAFAAARLLGGDLPKPRFASLRVLRNSGVELDQALVLVFEKGASFTGEESVELHLHGGPAVVNAVLAALSEIPGLRPASAGEFTRRALENGCLDLAQVEGLADLVDAETEAQRVQALRSMQGGLSDKTEIWRGSLVRAMALIEATIDFVDEDVPVDVTPEVTELLGLAIAQMKAEIVGGFAAERIREGFEVAIVGRPNVGKSTLLNALAGREAAITSSIAGTTRDVIAVSMEIGGLPVTFLDMAGIRDSNDVIEKIGVERAIERAIGADMRLYLTLDDAFDDHGIPQQQGDIVAVAKADLKQSQRRSVSGLTGQGIDNLLNDIYLELDRRVTGASMLTRERHRVALGSAVLRLDQAGVYLEYGEEMVELAAEEIRKAVVELDVLIGRVDVEQVLGEIFSSFCIGK